MKMELENNPLYKIWQQIIKRNEMDKDLSAANVIYCGAKFRVSLWQS